MSSLYRRDWKLQNRYNITIYDYWKLFEIQNGRCLICGIEEKLHVDHCHDSGEVRGLLCPRCNNGLGCFDDDVNKLRKAVEYLGSR